MLIVSTLKHFLSLIATRMWMKRCFDYNVMIEHDVVVLDKQSVSVWNITGEMKLSCDSLSNPL